MIRPDGRRSLTKGWLPSENTVMWLTAGGLLAFALVAFLDRHVFGHVSPLFWDLPVYLRAVDLLSAGQNPYDSELLHRAGVPNYLFFISPPAVAMLFTGVAKSPLRSLFEPALLLLHAIAIVGTPILLGRLLFGNAPARIALAAAAFLTLFAAAGLTAFGAMNNGSVINFLVLAAAMPGFARNRWTAFHIALTVATIFKPYYVFFWMIPVLAHGWNWRQVMAGAALATLAALTYVLPMWLAPDVFKEWATNVLTTLVIGGAGSSVFGAMEEWRTALQLQWLPHAAQLAYIGCLATLLLFGRMRGRQLWAALLMSAVFMNPRPLGYDVAIAAIPFAYLVATLLPESLGGGWRLALSTAASATVSMTSYNDVMAPSGIMFPLMAAGVLAACAIQPARAGKTVASSRHRHAPPMQGAKPSCRGPASAVEAESVQSRRPAHAH